MKEAVELLGIPRLKGVARAAVEARPKAMALWDGALRETMVVRGNPRPKVSTAVAVEVRGRPRLKGSAKVAVEVLPKVMALWADAASTPADEDLKNVRALWNVVTTLAVEVRGKPISKESFRVAVDSLPKAMALWAGASALTAEVRLKVAVNPNESVAVAVEVLGNPRPKESPRVAVEVRGRPSPKASPTVAVEVLPKAAAF